MPALIPPYSEMIPINQGMTMAPLLAAGSMTPILVTLVIRPALATAVGFKPAMEKAKANSEQNSRNLGMGGHQPNIKDNASNGHFNHGRRGIFDWKDKCNQHSGN